jgi:hypothetical protein
LKVHHNRLLRRIFGCKEKEITGNCRKSPNEELHDLQLSSNILRVTNTRRVILAERLARMGESGTVMGQPKRRILEDLVVDGRMTLKRC